MLPCFVNQWEASWCAIFHQNLDRHNIYLWATHLCQQCLNNHNVCANNVNMCFQIQQAWVFHAYHHRHIATETCMHARTRAHAYTGMLTHTYPCHTHTHYWKKTDQHIWSHAPKICHHFQPFLLLPRVIQQCIGAHNHLKLILGTPLNKYTSTKIYKQLKRQNKPHLFFKK